MKRIQRERVLTALYAELRGDDFDRRELALFQLALLLRRADDALDPRDAPAYVHDILTRAQSRIRLSRDEQAATVAALSRVIATRPESRATAVWALGSASAAAGMALLCELIATMGGRFQPEAAVQACAALSGWSLKRPASDFRDARPQLRVWAASDDERLACAAQAALRGLSDFAEG